MGIHQGSGGGGGGGGDAQTADPISQFAATSSAQLAGVISNETGTGLAVFNDSPALVTPDLGVPSSCDLTNCTDLPVAGLADGTDGELITWDAAGSPTTVAVGVAGQALVSNGPGAAPTFQAVGDALVANPLSQFAATTSAQLAGVISDETGSGALVFGTSPTLATPNLGTPSAATLTNATGLPIIAGTIGTLTVARGGTGLTALGTALQVLRVNAGATALEFATLSSGGAFTADGNTLITPTTPIVLNQATGNETALTLNYTTNKATSGNDTGLLINMTDTASPGNSLLIDLQVGASSICAVYNFGAMVLSQTSPYLLTVAGGTGGALLGRLASQGVSGLMVQSTGVIGFATGNVNGSTTNDTFLTRDAAGSLAQRNSTNAQAFKLYDSYADASNYARGFFRFASGVLEIGTEVAGTYAGTPRKLMLGTAAASLVGMYGATPVAQASAIANVSSGTDTAYETAINSILALLRNLGPLAT